MKFTNPRIKANLKNLSIARKLLETAFEDIKNLDAFRQVDGIGNKTHRDQVLQSITDIQGKLTLEMDPLSD